MMTELQKMRNGQPYNYEDEAVLASFVNAKKLCAQLRSMTEFDSNYRATIEALIPGIPPSATIVPPFYCDHGHGLQIGEGVFINAGCTVLDSAWVRIGAHAKIGPGCQLLTPIHPFDHTERRLPQEHALPIHIGADCWLGGGVIILPGVSIGPRTIVGAGSVVTHDLPADCVAAGNPCRILRYLDTTGK